MSSTSSEQRDPANHLETMRYQLKQAHRQTLLTQNSLPLQQYLDTKYKIQVKKLVQDVPTIFHKCWIITSINGHRKNLRRAIKYFNNKKFAKFTEELEISSLWLGQAIRIYEMIILMRNLDQTKINDLFISPDDTNKGDVVLSYKTKAYIKKSNVSRLVKLAGNSSITHVMLVAEGNLLHSGDETSGLGIKPIDPKPGELLLVMRLKDEQKLVALNLILDNWIELAKDRHRVSNKYDRLSFSELKCQVASLIGFATVLATYITIPASFHNPFKNRPGVFCSETVDTILKEGDIRIAPRCERDSVIGPVEFFTPPFWSSKESLLTKLILRKYSTKSENNLNKIIGLCLHNHRYSLVTIDACTSSSNRFHLDEARLVQSCLQDRTQKDFRQD